MKGVIAMCLKDLVVNKLARISGLNALRILERLRIPRFLQPATCMMRS